MVFPHNLRRLARVKRKVKYILILVIAVGCRVTIPGKPKADRFDSISQLGLSLHPVGAFSHGSIVEAACVRWRSAKAGVEEASIAMEEGRLAGLDMVQKLGYLSQDRATKKGGR